MLVGNRVRLTAEFRDVTGSYYDPATVLLTVQRPDKGEEAFSYPSSVSRSSAGVYYASVLIDIGGRWVCTWHSADLGAELVAQDVIVARGLI